MKGEATSSRWSYFNRPVTLPFLWQRKCEWTNIIQIHPISQISQPSPAFTHKHFTIKNLLASVTRLLFVLSSQAHHLPRDYRAHRRNIWWDHLGNSSLLTRVEELVVCQKTLFKISQTSTLTMASRRRGYFANDTSASSHLLPPRRHTISVDGRIEKPWTNGLQGSSNQNGVRIDAANRPFGRMYFRPAAKLTLIVEDDTTMKIDLTDSPSESECHFKRRGVTFESFQHF